MYIGIGIVLLVVGLIISLDVVTADIPYVDDPALGLILIVGGVLAIVLSLVLAAAARRRDTVVHHDHDHDASTYR